MLQIERGRQNTAGGDDMWGLLQDKADSLQSVCHCVIESDNVWWTKQSRLDQHINSLCCHRAFVYSWNKQFHTASCMDWVLFHTLQIKIWPFPYWKDSLKKLVPLNVYYNSDLSSCWMEKTSDEIFNSQRLCVSLYIRYNYHFLILSWIKVCKYVKLKNQCECMPRINDWTVNFVFILQMCLIANNLHVKQNSWAMFIHIQETLNSPIEYGVIFHIKKYKYTELQMIVL